MTRGRIPRWATRRPRLSTIRRRGPPPDEHAGRPGVGCRCARLPPGSPLRSDPAARGADGDLDPVSAHRRRAVTGSRPRPATLAARHHHDENRPGRLHLSNARFWSERWGPPQIDLTTSRGATCLRRRAPQRRARPERGTTDNDRPPRPATRDAMPQAGHPSRKRLFWSRTGNVSSV